MEQNNTKKLIRNAYIKYALFILSSFILTFLGSSLIQLHIVDLTSSCNLIMLLSLIVIILFIFTKNTLKKVMFWVYSLIQGLMLGCVFYKLNVNNPNSITSSLAITILITAVSMLIGFICRDLSRFKDILINIVFLIFIYLIISLFLKLPAVSIIIIIVFTLMVIVDFNIFKIAVRETNGEISNDDILEHVMEMYLNILNILLEVLDLSN